MTPALGLMLWHGGFRPPAQIAFAVLAAAGIVLFPSMPLQPRVLAIGLLLMAAADAVALALHFGPGSIASLLAVASLPVLVAVAVPAASRVRSELPLVVAVYGVTMATAGLAGLALRIEPLAERIGLIWRAAGTFEYPPALGLMCVCALAAVLALRGDGRLDGAVAALLASLLLACAAATYDRVAWIETTAVLILFAWRVRAVRRTVALATLAAVVAVMIAVAVARPHALAQHLRHGPISSRVGVWGDAWRGVRRHPLSGYGPGRFLDIYTNATDRTQTALAHNAPLEQAVESGIVGGAGACIVLAAMLVLGATALRSGDPVRLSQGVAAWAVALSGLYDFTWSFPPLLLLGLLSAVAARAP